MSLSLFDATLRAFVMLFGLYALAKLAFFFALGYRIRRKALDDAYAGRSYATARSDRVLLVVALIMSAALLARSAEPITFLGGLLAGATLVQLYFHAFHRPVPAEHEAPEPRSPLKIMSYAIQAKPASAWKEMLAMTVLILASTARYWIAR